MNKSTCGQTTQFRTGPWRISVLTSRLIRLEYDREAKFEDRFSQIVVNRNFPPVECQLNSAGSELYLTTEHARIWLDPTQFRYAAEEPNTAKRWNCGETLHNFGGTARTLDEVNGPTELGDGLFSEEGIGVMEDGTCLIDGERIFPRNQESHDLYLFLYGRSFMEGVQDFYRLCGQMPLLPKYALGNWWSRYWAYSEEEYMALMDRFEQERIPLSVAVVDMDWHLTKVPEGYNGWTGFTWNRELFPDPERFLKKLHDRGVRITLNLHPAEGVQPFEEAYPDVAAEMGVTDGKTVPFDFTDQRFRRTYFSKLLHPMEKQGVDFWWIDWQQGTASKIAGLDPLWLLNHFQYVDHLKSGREPLILSRYAGPGSHRYPIGFSGDTVVTWDSLNFQPYFTAMATNIGYGWWSHDIGGHMNGIKDDELAARWVQLGVFSPINRLHSTNNPFSGKEPWNYRAEACQEMEKFLRLRHALIPYLYTMNWRTHAEGIPLVRPLYHEWPEAEQAYRFPNEYLFGTELLAAPITQPAEPRSGLGQTRAWLPEGTYYDLFTGISYEGNREFTAYRPLSEMPVFVRAGSILPMQDQQEHLNLLVYPGADGEFQLVEENQENPEQPIRTDLVWKDDCLTVRPNAPMQAFDVCICGKKLEQAWLITGADRTLLDTAYDAARHMTRISVPALSQEAAVEMEQGADQQKTIRREQTEQTLRYAQMALDEKERIYLSVLKTGELPAVSEDLPEIVECALREILES